MKKIIMFVIITTLLMACGSRPDIKKEISGKEFALRDTVIVNEDHEIAFTIKFEGDKLGGKALNTYRSSYEIDGDSIRIYPVATTLMAGPEILMTREAEYLEDLSKAKGITFEDDVLTITTTDGSELIFDQIK